MRPAGLILLATLLWLTGCRDLVQPGGLEAVSGARRVEGRVLGVDAYLPVDGRVALRVRTARGIVVEPIAASPLQPDGRFVLEVPRGIDLPVLLDVTWSVGVPLLPYRFEPVTTHPDPLEVDYSAVHVSGRIEWPTGYSLAGAEPWLVEFSQGPSWGFPDAGENVSSALPDSAGAFAIGVPAGRWNLKAVVYRSESLDRLWLEWLDIEVAPDMRLEARAVPVRVEITAPPALAELSPIVLRAYREWDVDDHRVDVSARKVVRVETGTVDFWVPAEGGYFRADYPDSADSEIVLIGADLFDEFDPFPAGGVMRLDLGRSSVRLEVREDGALVEGARVDVPWRGEVWRGTTSVSGEVYVGLPGPTELRVEIEHEDRRWTVDAEVGDHLDLVVDLGALPESAR